MNRRRPHLGARAARFDELAVVLTGLLVAGASLGVILYSTGGHIAAPLDDAYVYLRYARLLADGSLFAYNVGDGYSSGAPSFLYLLLLTLFARLGAAGDGLLWAAQLLNAGLFALSAWLSYRLGLIARGRTVASLSALLFLLTAGLVWGYATATETGLLCTLLLLNLWLLARALGVGSRGTGVEGRRSAVGGRESGDGGQYALRTTHFALAGAVAALAWAAPEGVALAWITAGVLAWRAMASRGRDRGTLAAVVVGAVVGLAPMALDWVMTGHPLPNATLARSLVAQYPQAEPLELLRGWLGAFGDYFSGVYSGNSVATTVLPFALLFVMLGGMPAAWREIGRRAPGFFTLCMALFLGGMLVSTLLQPALRGRDQVPYYVIFDFLTGVGLYDLTRTLAGRRSRAAVIGVAGLGGLLMLGNLLTTWTMLGENAMDLYNGPVQAGNWAAANLPLGTRLAVVDGGAVAYYSRLYAYDLGGVTTNETAGLRAQGDGAVYERLRSLPPGRRPDFFVLSPGDFPEIALPGFFTPVYTVTLPHPTILEPNITVSKPNWVAVARGDAPLLDLRFDQVERPAVSVALSGARPGGPEGRLYLGRLVVERAGSVGVNFSGRGAAPTFELIEDESQFVARIPDDPAAPVYITTLLPGSYRLYVNEAAVGKAGSVAVTGARLLVERAVPAPERREVDRLNVSDIADEAAHGYVVRGAQWNDYAPAIVEAARLPGSAEPVADGGRRLTGYEEFTVATQPGKALEIVSRLRVDVPTRVRVSVDGQDAGIWFRPPAVGWGEASFVVAASLISRDRTRLRITLMPDGAFTPLRSFHYWFYQ